MPMTAKEIVDNAGQLPPPPKVMTELLALFARPDVDARRIADTVAAELALSLRTLQVANSPFYGLSKRVTSVHEAITILGFRAVRMLVLAVGSAQLMQLPPALRSSMGALLHHSTRCAMLARLLAESVDSPAEEAFTAGILHDVGKVVIAQTPSSDPAAAGINWIGRSDVALERTVFGTDHAEVGQALLTRWNFPDNLCMAVGQHHQRPETLSPLSAIVALADHVSHTGLDPVDTDALAALAPWITRALGDRPLPDVARMNATLADADALAHVLEHDN